jgi:hypothetical protein
MSAKKHRHDFVDTYDGLVGFGLDRQTDESTVIVYLQKLADDRLMDLLRQRLSQDDLEEIFSLINRLLKKYLNDSEYHDYFLIDEPGHHHDHP